MKHRLQYVYSILLLAGLIVYSASAFAINGRTTYQAKIYKPDGQPLEAVSVNFRFTVLDPSSSCVLFIEDYAAVNMIGSGGLTSFSLGMGTRTYPASGPTTFATVFDNSIPSFVCQTPGVYNPIPTDNRKVVMQFNEGSGWQTLPAMPINSVPYAMYSTKAQNSSLLNGKADSEFVEVSTLAALNCQVNEAIHFNGATFSCIAVGVASSGISSVTTSGTVLSTGGTASAPVISITAATMSSDGYLTSLDYAEFKAKLSASSTEIVSVLGYAPVSSSAVNTQIQASNLAGDVSGTIAANFVQSVGGKTSAQVATSVEDTIAATSSATADTIVKRNSSGNFTVNDVYANATKLNYVDIYRPSTSFNIRLPAPTSLAANYTLNLPTSSGTVGQVLSTDGSGNLSWISAATGSVTSVSATAPLISTGGSTPTISITQSTSSTNGYLSSADWNTFNNKQQATQAAIIATLGYTPANATSATQWTTSGTHISYSAGNVGIGTTTPVTKLDVSGGVRIGTENTTCAPALAGTLRYNISNIEYCNGTSWQAFGVSGAGITNINGSTSGTQSFATGTGGTAPNFNTSNGVHTLNIPLASTGSVTAGLLSNADYTTFSNKITSSAASIVQVLGYVPADNSVSGTYAQKANNLSDLTNIATARTNLGLGTFATASSIDLGSASATGTLAIARLPSFTGDATIATASNTIILSNSGVTAGAYTKVIVDSKGRVTSSAALALSDVTTALGYTPASATASTQWTTSGSAIYYNTGNVGVGTDNPGMISGSDAYLTLAKQTGKISLELYSSGNYTQGTDAGKIDFINRSTIPSDVNVARISSQVGSNTTRAHLAFFTRGLSGILSQRMLISENGNVGIGTQTPSALLNLAAGSVSNAPLKFTSGTLLSTPQSGTMEYDGNQYYLTDSANIRRTIATGSAAGSIDNASTINSTGNITMVPVGSVIVSSTTASTNSQTGALIVTGGLGVASNIYSSGTIITSSNMQGASITATNGLITPYVYGSTALGGSLSLESTTHANKGNILLANGGGNIGIGTTAPDYKMRVIGKIKVGTETDNVSANGQGDVNDVFELVSPNTASAPAMSFHHRGLHTVQISGFGSSVTSQGLRIKSGPGEQPAQLHVEGKVGVGTDAPISPIHAYGGTAMTAGYNRTLTVHANHPSIQFKGISNTNHSAGILYDAESSTEGMRFIVGATSDDVFGTGANVMSLQANGNVGIGTTDPQSHLHIAGTNRTLSLAGSASPEGNPSYLLMGNSDSAGVSGPTVMLSANRTVQFGVGDSFSSASGGNFTSYMTISSSGLDVIGSIKATNYVVANSTYTQAVNAGDNWIRIASGAGNSYADLRISGATSSQHAFMRLLVSCNFPNGSRGDNCDISIPQKSEHSITNFKSVRIVKLSTYDTYYVEVLLGNNSGATTNINVEAKDLSGFTILDPPVAGSIPASYSAQTVSAALSLASFGNGAFNIEHTGNIGIGTTSPAEKLDVSGRGRFSTTSAHVFKVTGVGSGYADATDGVATIYSENTAGSGGNILKLGSAFAPNTFVAKDNGNVGIGTSVPGEKLDVLGNMRIGSSDSNYIAFRGTTGDGAGSYNHTYIGERVHAAGESSELLLFKGNDSDNSSGPDRIRMVAGNIVFDTYASPDAPSGTFEAVAISSMTTTKMIIKGNGDVGVGVETPTSKLHVNGGIKQPNHGLIWLSFDGTTRITSMPAFLTDAYMNTHQDEVFTWRAPAPSLKDTVGCGAGPNPGYMISNVESTWGGTYRLIIGKAGATNIIELHYDGWGVQLLDASFGVIGTNSSQASVNATMTYSGGVWSIEHMQGQVGVTPFSCH